VRATSYQTPLNTWDGRWWSGRFGSLCVERFSSADAAERDESATNQRDQFPIQSTYTARSASPVASADA
jgi:hypothetical protein